MSYTLSLSNGKTFSGLDVNGNCFTSKVKISAEDFSGGLAHVTLSGEPDTDCGHAPFENGELPACRLGGVFFCDGLWYFWLMPYSEEELEHLQDRADIEYLAMMSEVEL